MLAGTGGRRYSRDRGDNALPLHHAAASGNLESVRALLDAGLDVRGAGELHALEAIGWATVSRTRTGRWWSRCWSAGRGTHVFSAIAVGDAALLGSVVRADLTAIRRRLSRFEQGQTALHYVIAPPDGLVGGTSRTGGHYPLLQTCIEPGADLEAQDVRGRTPLALAMLRGDQEAMRLLHAARAKQRGPAAQPMDPDGSAGGPLLPPQRAAAQARPRRIGRGAAPGEEVRFTTDLYTAFYGQREFSLRDPDRVDLNFYQPVG